MSLLTREQAVQLALVLIATGKVEMPRTEDETPAVWAKLTIEKFNEVVTKLIKESDQTLKAP